MVQRTLARAPQPIRASYLEPGLVALALAAATPGHALQERNTTAAFAASACGGASAPAATRRGLWLAPLVLGALDIGAVIGRYHHAGPRLDVRRYHHALAIGEHRWLIGRGGRLALHHRIGLDDFEGHARRQLRSEEHTSELQ